MKKEWNISTYITDKCNHITDVMKYTFIATMAIGLIAHFYVFSNKFMNYFEMGNILTTMAITKGDTLSFGRWFVPTATNLFTKYSIPSVTGFITLLYLSIAAVLIVDLLGIKSKLYGCLFGAAWITFPGLACIYSFGVNADAFCLSLLLAVAAGYALEKCKYGIVMGSIFLCFSLGIYQPYMSITIALVFLGLLRNVLSEEFCYKNFCKKFLKGIGMLALGFSLYYAVLQVMLAIVDVTLSGYHGVDSMTSFTLKGIAKGLVYTYIYFFQYFFTTAYLYTWTRVVGNIIAGILFFILLQRIIKKNKELSNKFQTSILMILVIFIPLGVNAAPFLMADRVGNGVDRYMIFAMMFLWAVFFMALDYVKEKELFGNQNLHSIINILSCGVVIIGILGSYLICNQAYYRMEANTQATTTLIEHIAVKIEEIPGWNKDKPIYFANCETLFNSNYEVIIPEFEELEFMPGTGLFPYYSENAIARYMKVYLHFPVELPTSQQKEDILLLDEFDTMPIYPTEGSISFINGVIVVKFNETETN
ncbi:MAG TPA: glucosyltransferase domain-containing protein [Sedimentibacter sp.]|nr:glucosyltransferase domain-containing protein [Sedimentibacter sp.]